MTISSSAVWVRFKPYVPDLFTKGSLNFITIHYLYIFGMAILGSILIFSIGGLAYIDALFFASGSATQSGLNTVDVNQTHTGQQIILYLLAMLCNPIVIHGSLVFVRLHSFEKRFKHVVEEARNLRRAKSKARVASRAKDDPESGRKDHGVRGRPIIVLHDGHAFEGSLSDVHPDPDAAAKLGDQSETSSDRTAQNEVTGEGGDGAHLDSLHPDSTRLPQRLSVDDHIAFLENQRSPKDKGTLRIPSPREFDRGGKPHDVGDEETAALSRKATGPLDRQHLTQPGHARSQTGTNRITINEPKVSRSHDKANLTERVDSEKLASRTTSSQQPSGLMSNVRSRQVGGEIKSLIRSNTSFLRSRDDEPKEEAPYLSWIPTIARNSTFINLSEDQREELGGIEYRALKTLAVILAVYFLAFHLLGVICLTPWILRSGTYGPVVTDAGVGRPWWGIFTAASAFNDLGYTLTPDSMISFGTAVFPLLLMTFLILIGNTAFPCMLRFIIWLTSKFVPRGSALWDELRFLLDHPRRCFTLLFPRAATWWLFAVLVVLNAVDVLFFVILDVSSSCHSSRLLDLGRPLT
jgi:hypothetical protein